MKRTLYVYLLASIITFGTLITCIGLNVNLPKEEELTPDTIVLVWVDALNPGHYPWEYLDSIAKCNATIPRTIPSTDRTQFWFLVETHFRNIPELEKLPFAVNVTFAEAGNYGNRSVQWWEKTKVDPLMRLMAKKVGNGELDVYVFYDENENLNRTEIEKQITTLAELAKGRVLRTSTYSGLMEIIVPGNTLDLVAANPYVEELHAIELIVLRNPA